MLRLRGALPRCCSPAAIAGRSAARWPNATTRRDDSQGALPAAQRSGRGEQAAASTGTGWATIHGQFVFDGTPPPMPPYNVTKEQDICTHRRQGAAAGNAASSTAASKGIKNVAVYLRDASRVHDSAKPKTEPVVFDQKECVFLTHVLRRHGRPDARHQEQRSDRPQHEHRRQQNSFNQTIPAGGSDSLHGAEGRSDAGTRSPAASIRG